ncbi:MAG: Uma2 family endonuclease [Dehalococcoidia bacterium]
MTQTALPRLETGDRLTRAEFHRRYCARPDIHKAELIEGVVYVASPERFRLHSEPQSAVVGWLYVYTIAHPGVRLGISPTIMLDDANEVQPDACLFRDPPPPGGARVGHDDYLEGAPQLIVEVAASSRGRDLGTKKEAYRRAGVLEYLVWQVERRVFTWFRLQDGQYVAVAPDARGVIASVAFAGLRLAVASLLAGDHAAVAAELSAGVDAE